MSNSQKSQLEFWSPINNENKNKSDIVSDIVLINDREAKLQKNNNSFSEEVNYETVYANEVFDNIAVNMEIESGLNDVNENDAFNMEIESGLTNLNGNNGMKIIEIESGSINLDSNIATILEFENSFLHCSALSNCFIIYGDNENGYEPASSSNNDNNNNKTNYCVLMDENNNEESSHDLSATCKNYRNSTKKIGSGKSHDHTGYRRKSKTSNTEKNYNVRPTGYRNSIKWNNNKNIYSRKDNRNSVKMRNKFLDSTQSTERTVFNDNGYNSKVNDNDAHTMRAKFGSRDAKKQSIISEDSKNMEDKISEEEASEICNNHAFKLKPNNMRMFGEKHEGTLTVPNRIIVGYIKIPKCCLLL